MLCVHGIPAVIVGGIGETMKNEKKDAGNLTVSVIIPVYKPDDKFPKLLRMLEKQTCSFERLIIMNTENSTGRKNGKNWFPKWKYIISGERNLTMEEPGPRLQTCVPAIFWYILRRMQFRQMNM